MVYIIKFLFCGLITAFLFPPFLILPVGFIIFPYLFFLITDQKLLNASKYMHFIYGIFYGLGLNIIVLFWIKEPFYFNSGTKSIAYISYLLVLYVSIYYGFAFFILCFFKNGFAKLILLPVLFVIVEILREKISFGFPWVTFSLISSANFLIVNLAFYVGTYGLSYIIIFIFLIPVSIILLFPSVNVYEPFP